MGGVLMLKGKVIAYAFRQLKTHAKNYPTHELGLATMALQHDLGTRLDMSTTFHSQKDEQSKWTIQMTPFEVLYGRQCRSPIGWFDTTKMDSLDTNFLRNVMEQVPKIQGRLLTAQSQQKSKVVSTSLEA
ncbi:hypothetical protein MTR67_026960 [Solanum verrucosum]|uniref:Reverse transcriptase RNase H-like domain-containing protein n=1 Tax=Solanum verrucosum TaxID=315347 RepID=A0AAF0R389_SOLVR|nr:hypothetical protein MTR67_026960 [Solanum verrucosum]